MTAINTKTLHSTILTTSTSGACRTRAICSAVEILFCHNTRPTRRAAISSECRTQAICSAAETSLRHHVRLTWKAATSNAC
eukprot:782315-Amorphochlora_amoeboformis.AAC.1